jgi:hypothetical protein
MPPNEELDVSLPLACSFARKIFFRIPSDIKEQILNEISVKDIGDEKRLAITNEAGYVALYDTSNELSQGPDCLWKAHDNAIFDIAWTCDNRQLVFLIQF